MTVSAIFTDLQPKQIAILPGIAFRRSVRLYLLSVAAVMFLLLLTAWSIDLAEKFSEVRDAAAQRGVALGTIMAPYLFYRAVDIVTRLLPIACFVGVFVAEIMRRRRLETTIFTAAGYSPLQSLSAVLAVSLIIGALQFGLERSWRPQAVYAQVALGVGSYADRFKPGLTRNPYWFLSGNDAMMAMVVRDDEPELRRIELYRGFSSDRLNQVIVADSGLPTATPSVWRLYNAIVWDRVGESYQPSTRATLDIDFKLLPQQLTYLDVPGFYLPNDDLVRIAAMRAAPNIQDIDLAIWRRWTALLLPGAFLLLGVSFGQTVWSGRMLMPARALGLSFCGYLMIVSVKVFWSLGELGSISAFLSASLTIGLAMAVSAVIQFFRS